MKQNGRLVSGRLRCQRDRTPTNCTSCIFVGQNSSTPEQIVGLKLGLSHEPFETDCSVVLESFESMQKSVKSHLKERRAFGIKKEKKNFWLAL